MDRDGEGRGGKLVRPEQSASLGYLHTSRRQRQILGAGLVCRIALAPLLLAAVSAAANASPGQRSASSSSEPSVHSSALTESCHLLDDPKVHGRMDGLLIQLARACGRQAQFLGHVESDPEQAVRGPQVGTDTKVNDPSSDAGPSRTQSETSIAHNEDTGTLCAAYNDSYHFTTEGQGFSGFSRSIDGGNSWEDRGAVSNDDSGDPSLVWRRADGKFYYAAVRLGGLALYRSDDDCLSFGFVSQFASTLDDKELMAIDNNPSSPFYGRIYVVWTDFGNAGRIHSIHSSDGGASWSAQLALSDFTLDVQSAWPAIAPNGDVYVAWILWRPPAGFPAGDLEVAVARSTNGGVSFSNLPPPMRGKATPRDATASNAGNCQRPALKGNIRMMPNPQIAFGSDYLHAVYSYDPDGYDSGDVVDVFYRRYDPASGQWGPEHRVNDDATLTDQYGPTLAVGDADQVTIGYYSRQLDPDNLQIDFYSRTSFDNGASWPDPSVRMSQQSAPIVLDPALANCYHGDYDQQMHDGLGQALYLWSDDRDGDADVHTDQSTVGSEFLIVPEQYYAAVCAPEAAQYPLTIHPFQDFSEAITLSVSGLPSGALSSFSDNGQAPPFSSNLTVTTAAAAPGFATISLTGVASPSGITRSSYVQLEVYTATPGAASPLAPPNLAALVSRRPTFVWQAASQAGSYVLEISQQADFSGPLVYSASVVGTEHQPSVDLPASTVLYWRLRADNRCATGPDSPIFSFSTIPEPGNCPLGQFTQTLYSTDFEGDNSAWTQGAGSFGESNWAISTSRPWSGSRSFLAMDLGTVSDQRLVSPAINLPTGLTPLSLVYASAQYIDGDTLVCYHGGILEISTDNGASFAQLPDTALLTDPYDAVIRQPGSNPLAGLPVWCLDTVYRRSVVDLNAYAGQTVRLRFRLGTDSVIGFEPDGWFVDDVAVLGCSEVPPEAMFADGFE